MTAYDLLAWIGRDIPLSTAADNSARFPGVGAAGTLRDPNSGEIFVLSGYAKRQIDAYLGLGDEAPLDCTASNQDHLKEIGLLLGAASGS